MAPSYANIPPKTLIFDTGPLWELFLFQAVHDYKFSRLANLLKHVKTRTQFRKLTDYIKSFTTITTTPLVVAEVSYWIGEAEKKSERYVNRILREAFGQAKCIRLLNSFSASWRVADPERSAI